MENSKMTNEAPPVRRQTFSITPSAERLAKPSQRVTVFNSHPLQTHIIRDRFMQGHELQPGQRKEIELLAEDIQYFVRERDPSRRTPLGVAKPLHPIVIEGIGDYNELLGKLRA
jgi:hypothetical protein